IPNPEVAALAERFCEEIGFRGIADLDWRLDLRDGRYKLVDFNPRVGNQFRLFETEAGIDVVRAMHLDLTGRPVPPGGQPVPRRATPRDGGVGGPRGGRPAVTARSASARPFRVRQRESRLSMRGWPATIRFHSLS